MAHGVGRLSGDRRRTLDAVASIAAVVLCLAAVFLPWAQSGSVERSGYDLLASAQRAGLVTASWARVLAVAAYLLPTMAAATVAAWLVGRPRLALAVAAVTGAVLVAGSSVVIAVVNGGLLAGATVGVAIGCLTVVGMALRLGGGRDG